jgi:RimJ/RimL family protein N-acetyltransferase
MLTTLPNLETERLRLRPFLMSDAPTVQLMVSAHEIANTTIALPHPYPEDGASTWISTHVLNLEKGIYPFAIASKKDDVVLGSIGITINRKHNKGELGYWIGVPYWNQGYATEATRRIVKWAFEELKLNRVFGRYLIRNYASGRVMQKAGLKHEGIFIQDILKWNIYEDLGQCGLIQAEYLKLASQN